MSDDRFGMPDSAFRAAREHHRRDNPTVRLGRYVPTRRDVVTLGADDIAFLLDLWMWESPTELIPSDDQIREVRSVVSSRLDADTPEVQAIIAEYDRHLQQTD